MNKNLKSAALLGAAIFAYTSQGCRPGDHDVPAQDNHNSSNHNNSGSWDEAAQKTPAEDQHDKWGVQDYVNRYDAGVEPPQEKQVYKDDKGDQFIEMLVPARVIDKNRADDTSLVKVYKQLDGQKTQPVTDSTQEHYHSTPVVVRWYPYNGSYYYGGGYSPEYSHQYSGYYTKMNEPVQNSAERAVNHTNFMRGNMRSIVNYKSSVARVSKAFRFNARMSASPERAGGYRGGFGKSSFRGGGFGE
jgi:hypothetical protein